MPPEKSRFSEANDVTLFCLIDSTLLCVKDQGTFLILVCLVNFQSSGKGSNSSSEHVGTPVFDF